MLQILHLLCSGLGKCLCLELFFFFEMTFWGNPRNRLFRPSSPNIFIMKFFLQEPGAS